MSLSDETKAREEVKLTMDCCSSARGLQKGIISLKIKCSPTTILSTSCLGRTGRPDPMISALRVRRKRNVLRAFFPLVSLRLGDWGLFWLLKVGKESETFPGGELPTVTL